jgi:hypothetical protein
VRFGFVAKHRGAWPVLDWTSVIPGSAVRDADGHGYLSRLCRNAPCYSVFTTNAT